MEPKDAMRIAKGAKFGLSYIPEEQIPHGGLLFPGGHIIPYYNPGIYILLFVCLIDRIFNHLDHGPTVPMKDAIPPIPIEMKKITEVSNFDMLDF